jgi:hypothetical protein
MTGVDTIVTKADIMEEEIAITETEGQLTTIICILVVDIVVVALLHIHVVVVALLQGEGTPEVPLQATGMHLLNLIKLKEGHLHLPEDLGHLL